MSVTSLSRCSVLNRFSSLALVLLAASSRQLSTLTLLCRDAEGLRMWLLACSLSEARIPSSSSELLDNSADAFWTSLPNVNDWGSSSADALRGPATLGELDRTSLPGCRDPPLPDTGVDRPTLRTLGWMLMISVMSPRSTDWMSASALLMSNLWTAIFGTSTDDAESTTNQQSMLSRLTIKQIMCNIRA